MFNMSEETINKEKIKVIIERKANALIELRLNMKHYRSRHSIPISKFKRWVEEVLFYIDNPHYKRKKYFSTSQE